ncbi:MFS transporter, partial [Klebsiella pneumoniae]|nr:MFS transporter [Klebsiella pneumoniae]
HVALPMLAHDLGAGPEAASWILLSYMLVITVLILVFGRLADLFGRRRLYLGGLVLLTLASVGCGLAQDTPTMLLFRCLQAIGAAAVIANTT